LKYTLLFSLVIFMFSCSKEEVGITECLCEQGDFVPFYKGCPNERCDSTIFKCAEGAFLDKIYENLSYPIEARQDTIEGMVIVQMTVTKNGSLTDFATLNEPLGYGLEEAALEAAMALADVGFYPAYENCEPVNFDYLFPVRFTLAR
jgi:TonB family protein